ncbi:prolyl-tRNA synthetase associated domain-containing protein [Terrisporobacter sp.]
MDKREKVLNKLNELEIKYKLIDHPPVYTIDAMDELNLSEHGHIVKNLFLKNSNGKKHYLVVLKGDKKADLKSIKSQINSTSLSFASEERLEKYLGLLKGAVTPLGIINDEDHCVCIVLDKDLKNEEFIGIHPNVNTATVFISYNDLLKFINTFGNKIFYVNI